MSVGSIPPQIPKPRTVALPHLTQADPLVLTGEGWARKLPTVHAAYWLWRAVALGVVS